jgi:hypothetical protein
LAALRPPEQDQDEENNTAESKLETSSDNDSINISSDDNHVHKCETHKIDEILFNDQGQLMKHAKKKKDNNLIFKCRNLILNPIMRSNILYWACTLSEE